ncbi:MAG: hypothetical protein J5761_00445 [Paludibacteraceae bacterium]|nr:hypothetical protein [Paludibacteraceae bacterium]
MRNLFTLVCVALISASMLADQVTLAWNLGENGAAPEPANVITGAAGSPAAGWTIAITGNTSKSWNAGNGKIFLNGDSLMTIKNSNGAQNTVTLPAGLYASKVEFYAVTNDTTAKGTLKEFDGEACKDSVHSLKDYDNPTYIAKQLDMAKNQFTFTFGGKQVCFIAVVTYSNQEPEEPKPFAVLSWMLGENGVEATAANAITGATGSAAEGWTIAMTGNAEKNWSGANKLSYKGVEYKSLKNSNGVQITVTLPEGLYATDVEFIAVTNDDAEVGSLKEFDGASVKDTVFSLKDYTAPTHITKSLATPKNEFTFLFGGKQVCFIAAVTYTDEAPEEPQGIEELTANGQELKARKIISNGQLVIIKNGIRYNVLGTQL